MSTVGGQAIPVSTLCDLSIEIRVDPRQPLHGWLGPSIRGWLLAAMKGIRRDANGNNDRLPLDPEGMCRLAPMFEKASDAVCATCWMQSNCEFGKTFEGPLRAPVAKGKTQIDPPKAASFLSPVLAGLDPDAERIHLSIAVQLLGRAAAEEAETVAERISNISHGFIGPHQARLWSDAMFIKHELVTTDGFIAPPSVDSPKVGSVDLVFESPLFVKKKHALDFDGERIFRFLFCQSQAVIASLLCRRDHRATDFRGLASLADSVRNVSRDLSKMEQFRVSSRSSPGRSGRRRSHQMVGWIGTLRFREVPACLLPWIRWGGVVGVGDHRTAGGGRWVTIVHPG